MTRQLSLAALTAAALVSPLAAQIGSQTFKIETETVTGNNLQLGVAYDELSGLIYTTASGFPTNTPPHQIYVFDQTGAQIAQFDQPAASNATTWGYRDGASNLIGQLFFGWDGGIDCYDPAVGNPPTALTPATTVLAANGPQPIVGAANPNTIQSPAITGTHRAIAYDFFGNAGNGSFFVGNFGGDIYEIAVDGTLLHQYPNTDAWSAYGLALDPNRGTLWINSAPNAGAIKEYAIDRTANTLTPTGLQIERDQPGTAQGGLEFVPNGLDGRNCGSDLLGVDQGTPDTLAGYRLELWNNYNPANEPQLVVGVDGGPLTTGNVDVQPSNSSIEIDCTAQPGFPYILYFDATGSAPRPRGPIVPTLPSTTEFTFPRLGGVQAGGFTSGFPISINTAALSSIAPGTVIEWQAMALDLNVPVGTCGLTLPLNATNIPTHTKAIVNFNVRVSATGSNSFNADPTSGFFRIETGPLSVGDPIVSVEFDWVNSTNPGQATMEFDCDQGGMANAFWEGNGPSGCTGTYRNGSDVTVGLDYANAANNLLDTSLTCATSVAHCEATNQVGTTPDYRTLKWYFTGDTFTGVGTALEFDIDTDGGAGISGGAMDGMVVTVEFLSGNVLTGQLVVDPNNALRSSVDL
ncbi:MAG: hypothetical protein VX044_03235 [Planctomycetota bacterium]|nr:hypothetical protein [Planctomycetota bacterium]